MDNILKQIQEDMRNGDVDTMKNNIQEALDKGHEAKDIIDKALLPTMGALGKAFTEHTVFIPEVMIASRAMNEGLIFLKDYMDHESDEIGVAVIGTVKGDCHDIGKNIVKTMIEGKGIRTIDLGVDVSAEKYVMAAKEAKAQIICCSALLTSTMGEMDRVVKLVKEEKLPCKVMVGGAVVSQKFSDSIGADCYTADAYTAAEAAKEICCKN